MNILFLTNELRYTCGVTNHLLHLAGELAKNSKHKIFIITGGGNGIDRFDDINIKILEDKRFLHENRNSVNYLSAVNILSKFIRQNKIDILHSHSHYAANIAAMVTKLRKIPKVQTNHGILEEKGKLNHFSADKYVAINEHIYNYIIENKITAAENVKFIRCGIQIPIELSMKTHSPVKVLAASRFIHEKGLDLYIKAVSEIEYEIKSKAEFYIAGEGEEESNLKKLNDDLNAGVKFLGRVNNLGNTLKDTHIFVYTSRSKSEGFPAVITEAGAFNNLLIISDFKGVDSVVKDNVDALVFPVNDVKKLAEQIREAILNYNNLSKIAEQFYYKVKDLYDLNKMISKHEELYSQCLKP
jgi:glycosyltransferase involved in cell wall biosynthesis